MEDNVGKVLVGIGKELSHLGIAQRANSLLVEVRGQRAEILAKYRFVKSEDKWFAEKEL